MNKILATGLLGLALVSAIPAVAADSKADKTWQEAWTAYNIGQYKKTLRLLQPLASDGDARSQVLLGRCYENGLGVPQEEGQLVQQRGQGVPVPFLPFQPDAEGHKVGLPAAAQDLQQRFGGLGLLAEGSGFALQLRHRPAQQPLAVLRGGLPLLLRALGVAPGQPGFRLRRGHRRQGQGLAAGADGGQQGGGVIGEQEKGGVGRAVSREALMTKLWETDCYVDENTLTVNVTRLRRNLEAVGLELFITTKKGIGYMVP